MLLAQRVHRALERIQSSPFISPRTQEERNARLLYLNSAMAGVGLGGIVAFMPVFLARLGVDSTVMGWFNSAPALLTVFFLIPGAVIAERNPDQVKVRVRYVQIIRLSYLVCALLPFVVPATYLPWALIAIWALKTFPEAVAIPAWTAVMANAIRPSQRAQINGVRWALMSLVMAASSAFFGWLLDRIVFPLNYQVVFFLSFALAGLDPFFFAHIKIPAGTVPVVSRTQHLLARVREYFGPVLVHKPFGLYLLSTILYRIALNMPAPLLSLFWVNELQASDTLIGLRGTVGYGALVVGYVFWGRSANRLGHVRVLTWGAMGLALYVLLTAFIPSAWWLLPAAGLWGLAAGGVDIGLFDLMLASCPKERQPLFAAVWSMVANGAIFIGPLIGAALARATSLRTALIIAALAQALTTLPFIALPKDV